jgi:hypothetical protein
VAAEANTIRRPAKPQPTYIDQNGATEKQMMALFGWDSPTLAAFYAKMADQKTLAKAAVHTLVHQAAI